MSAKDVRWDLQNLADPKKAVILQRFFKTGPGEYGEGDVFLGIMVPQSRQVAKKYIGLPLQQVNALLGSNIHEERLVALLILVYKYAHASVKEKSDIARFYLDNLKQINNWDLVDLSAPIILGSFLMENDRSVLYRLAKSDNIWERRVAILATMQFIKNGEFSDTLKLARILLRDDHDLIHKAVGWMLREVGKRDLALEEAFLDKHYRVMPRTALRYAIERLPERKKRRYMKIAR
jgi:3-methyladenine DNA glycosylase AlkD